MVEQLIVGMAGAGGDGVVAAGEILITAAAREGYHGIMSKSFGPQIRGGESSCRLRLSSRRVRSPGGVLDVAVALSWDDFLKFGGELPVDGTTLVVYDSASGIEPGALPLANVVPADVHAVPIGALAKEVAGSERARNSVVVGLLAAWMGLSQESVAVAIGKRFGKKGDEQVESNLKAVQAGFDYATAHPLARSRALSPADGGEKLLADGNEMCAMAALFAGCRFFSGYPITPSSEIMQTLDKEIWSYGGTMLQAEDEIAGVAAAIGASFAGTKAMTATSGPGMSLKTEALGLATIAELPLVCVDVQRGGPSTGIPTKSEQSDLFQAAFSAHGDVVRPVLAPTDVEDTFSITVEAFNLAEELQTPVIVLSDQDIAQSKQTTAVIDTSRFRIVDRRRPTPAELERYARFRLTPSGVSPISQPGMPGGNYLASGIEHNESGAPTAGGEMHARMNDKRIRKLRPLLRRRDLFTVEGDAHAAIALVAWGSLAGVALEARELAKVDGIDVKVLVPRLLYPVAEEIYEEFFRSVKAGLIVEQSHQGQLFRLLRMFVDVPRGLESFAKSGSNPITPREVSRKLRQMVLSLQRQLEPQLL